MFFHFKEQQITTPLYYFAYMKRVLAVFCTVIFLSISFVRVYGSGEPLTPTVSPTFFSPSTTITVTYDVTGTSLANLPAAYAWVWIPGKNINAKYNIDPASGSGTTSAVKFLKTDLEGKTYFSLTFKPSDLFAVSIAAETAMGILLKGNAWADGQTSDYIATFWDGQYDLKLLKPVQNFFFAETGDAVNIQAETPTASDFQLYVNDVLVQSAASQTVFTYTNAVTATSGVTAVRITSSAGADNEEVSFEYLIKEQSPVVSRPAGIVDGINYDPNDPTKVTLGLWAPAHSSVYVMGDFSDWNVLPENLMNRDGEHFWIELSGLTPGVEYAFQYYIDYSIKVADPYADKILDPADADIASTTYLDLKPYPAMALNNEWYFNRVSVFQTNQTPYNWQVDDFVAPAATDLVIYELLIRDFFGDGHKDYQTLIDTIGYFKNLGVNAIELMPIMEFSGNDSWGYNPNFMFAPDKSYGTKNKLKEFIDICHQNGIAVILDIAMNHQDTPNPYLLMDFNFTSFQPNPTNPWFNVTATHPFSVFFDMNHESTYTKKYLDTVNYYWLNEYKVDGFRFDLSKGFTQTNNPDNVSAWSAKDDSRIAILERMSDKIRQHTPDAILILEHLAENSEEKILADYGFLLWGNLNYAYNQMSMGFSTGADISGSSYKSRNWNDPHLVVYMESHDEERMMYRNIKTGNSSGSYSTRNVNTALERMKASAIFHYAIPGPKMLWQFGELGYDISIDQNGRTGAKPVKWDYYDNVYRKKLFTTVSDMIKLKTTYDVFETTDFTLTAGTSLQKQLTLKNNPYTATPSGTDEMNAVIIGNFDVTAKTMTSTFPHTGNWFHYFANGDTLKLTSATVSIPLQPGEVRLYTDVKLPGVENELLQYSGPNAPDLVSLSQTGNEITVKWIDNSLIESGYNIYRRKAGEDFALVGELGVGYTTFDDATDLEGNTEYDYFVAAKNQVFATPSDTLSITSMEIITSLEDEIASSISLYPVPTGQFLRIDSAVEIQSLDVHSVQGLSYTLRRVDENTWSTEGLGGGLYIITIKTTKESANVKIIKN